MINSILYAGPWDPETLLAALTAAGHENKIYELTGPEALSHEQIAEKPKPRRKWVEEGRGDLGRHVGV